MIISGLSGTAPSQVSWPLRLLQGLDSFCPLWKETPVELLWESNSAPENSPWKYIGLWYSLKANI